MKKIINKFIPYLIAITLAGCGQKDAPKENIENQSSDSIQYIIGIGKIVPKDGIAILSVSQANKVMRIYKKLGDTVHKGDILFEMEAVDESLNLAKNEAATHTAQANLQVSENDIKNAEIKLAELEYEYKTSRNLFSQNAETRQQLVKDSIAYFQQLSIIQQYKNQLNAQKSIVKERQVDERISKSKINQQSYKVEQDGILTRFDISLGQMLTPNDIFGEIASNSELVIEGEIDEFYASQLKEGLKVEMTLVGQTEIIATGIITYAGSGLQNKSILYESKGEGSDRRVRRFTVKIDSKNTELLINQKVECKIHLP